MKEKNERIERKNPLFPLTLFILFHPFRASRVVSEDPSCLLI